MSSTKKTTHNLFNINPIDPNALQSLLAILFDDLARRVEHSETVTLETFTLFYQLPYFISKRIFSTFKKQKEDKLTKNEFIQNFIWVYCGDFEEKLKFYFYFLDTNSSGKIDLQELKTMLYQFHLILSETDFSILEKIIYNFNSLNNNINFFLLDEWIKFNQEVNSDIFIILDYFFYRKKPFANHFLRLYFDNPNEIFTPKSQINYIVSNTLKEYIKSISVKRDNIIVEKLMKDDTDVVSKKNKCFNDDELQLIGLNYFSKSRSSKNLTRLYSKYKGEKEGLSQILQPAEVSRNRLNTQFTENSSTRCEECAGEEFFNENETSGTNHHSSTTLGSLNIYTTGVSARLYEPADNNLSEQIYVDVYDYNLLVLKPDEKGESKSVIHICDLRYSYIEWELSIVNIGGTNYYQIQIGISLSHSASLTLLFKQKNDYSSFLARLKSYSLLRAVTTRYEIKEIVGGGGFGSVYRAIKKSTNETYAIKIVNKSKIKPSEFKFIQEEISIMKFLQNVRHTNIIKVYEIYENTENIYFVLEYLPLGNLSMYYPTLKPTLCAATLKSITKQILNATSFMHKIGIVHRDLKLNNIMIDKGENNKLIMKLIDFGFSTMATKNEKIHEVIGTLNYLPPEIVNREEYNNKVDVWSFGIIMYYLRYCRFPFEDMRNKVRFIYQNICVGRFKFGTFRYDFTDEEDIEYKKIILRCLQIDMNKRASFDELKKEQWFAN